ncbi:MAG: tetratricopeptide repeat protein [Acidobacteriota bacterium]
MLHSPSRFGSALLLTSIVLAANASSQSETPGAKYARAKEAMASGQFAQAVALFEELAQAFPEDPGTWMNLGLAHYMAGQPVKAIKHLERALQMEPELVPAWLFLGTAHLDLGEPAQAIQPLRRVVAAQPKNLDARRMLADALFATRRYQEAAEHFRELTRLNPKSASVWYKLGQSYEALAQLAFDELEKAGRDSAYWLVLIAQTLEKSQKYANAFYFYRKALLKQPSMRGLHQALSRVYHRTHHPEWAAVEERKEHLLGPPDCQTQKLGCEFLAGHDTDVVKLARESKTRESYYWRVEAYNRMALEAYSQLMRLPPSRERHELVAQLYSNQRRYREAVQELQKALRLEPHNPQLRTQLAQALYQSRDYESVQRLVGKGLQGQADSAELNFIRGDSLLQLQRIADAIPFLERAVKQRPALRPAHLSLGRAYLLAGRAEQAIPELSKVLDGDEDGSIHYQLAQAYQRTQQPELAKQYLRKYQEIQKRAVAQREALEKEVQITPP